MVGLTFSPPAATELHHFYRRDPQDGIPFTMFTVDDVRGEFKRLRGLGVRVTQEPASMGPVTTAVLDDTCGNLIQLTQMNATE